MELQLFMDAAVQYYKDKGQLSHDPITFDLGWKGVGGGSGLRYPGKLSLDDKGERLFVADSSNHRILVIERKSGQWVWLLSMVTTTCYVLLLYMCIHVTRERAREREREKVSL